MPTEAPFKPTLTNEQQAAVESRADVLAVNAFAGTGKTSTLSAYAEARPSQKILYLAFNKAIQLEAASRFPPNVDCKTAHGLAYFSVGKSYNDQVDRFCPDAPIGKGITSKLQPSVVAKHFNITPFDAQAAIDILTLFAGSSATKVDETCLPSGPAAIKRSPREKIMLITKARALWDAVIDKENTEILMTHDVYLKLYQLSRPSLADKYDIILFDEAQDASGAMVDIVRRQACGKVFVGDVHQSIYGFRGAVNAMEAIQADSNFSLTQSFRFGDGVAKVANRLLREFKGETRDIVGRGKYKTEFNVNKNAPYTLISRTNSQLFDSAITALTSGLSFGFVGGAAGYQFNKLKDVYYLYNKQKSDIRDSNIRSFGSFDDMEALGKQVDDKEILSAAWIVKKYGGRIPGMVGAIQSRATENLKEAHLIMTTAHKSKGLEFKQVVLSDDFADLNDDDKEGPPDAEEINLIYVAATRAEQALSLSPRMQEWYDSVKKPAKKTMQT